VEIALQVVPPNIDRQHSESRNRVKRVIPQRKKEEEEEEKKKKSS